MERVIIVAVKRVTNKDIILINTLYKEYKNKARVARETGFSASTVAKYIIDDFQAPNDGVSLEPREEPVIDLTPFRAKNWNHLTLLNDEEKKFMDMARKLVTL